MQPVTIAGIIIRFKGNGRKLGYPTANLSTETAVADGVYFGFADMAPFLQCPALVFIGVPTTIGDSKRRVEVHLLDIADEDYYGLQLSVTLHQYYRANKTFANIDQLLQAIHGDEAAARQWFAKYPSAS
jgi:riboflavin kinase/FMN adenylyltransferase